jgi:hypothetical protein
VTTGLGRAIWHGEMMKETWTQPERVYIVSALLFDLANEQHRTIRGMGEEILSLMEESWERDGGDIGKPPRPDGGGTYKELEPGRRFRMTPTF